MHQLFSLLQPVETTPGATGASGALPSVESVQKALDSAVGSVVSAIQAQPWGVHAVMGGLVVLGLVLWMFGRRFLRPVVALAGGGIGGFVGYMAIPVVFPGSGLSPFVGMVGGGVIGLLLALFLFKAVTALGFGVILAVGSMFVAAGVLNVAGAPTLSAGSTGQQVAQSAERAVDGVLSDEPAVQADGAQVGPDPYPNLAPMTRAVRDLAKAAKNEAVVRWKALPEAHRPWVALAGGGGALVGVLIGLVMPAWASGVVTALAGAAIWLSAGVWLWHAFALPGSVEMAKVTPVGWVVVWLVAGLLGMVAQAKMSCAKPAPAPPPQAPPPAQPPAAS